MIVSRGGQKGTRIRRLRSILWLEIALLIIVVLVTVAPISIGMRVLGKSGSEAANLYYLLSCVIILLSQALYMTPLRQLQLLSWKALLIGASILAALLWLWIAREDGRLLNFSRMEEGRIFGPIVWAVGFPMFQGLANVFSIGTKQVNPIESGAAR